MTGQGAQPHPFRHALDQPPWRCRDCDASAADPLHCPHPAAHCSPSCDCQCRNCAQCRAAGYDHADPPRFPGITAAEVEQWARDHDMTHVAEFDKAGNNVTDDTDPELTGNPDGIGVLAQEADLPDWMVAGQTVATEQPLAAFILARMDYQEQVIRQSASEPGHDWVEPFTPKRAMAGVEVERAIVRDHLAVHEIVGDDAPCTCHLLRQLASIWSDHEAYLPEWRLR